MNLSKPNNNAKTEINLLKEEINSIKEIDSKTKDHILLELQFKINYQEYEQKNLMAGSKSKLIKKFKMKKLPN